jgi:DNA-binding GntR family transcriptional regulator
VYIDARYDEIAGDIGKRTVPIYSLIESRYGVTTVKVRQEVSAMAIPAEAARALKVKKGSSGLAILRHYLDSEERVFEVTMSVYPAETLSLQRGVEARVRERARALGCGSAVE